MRPAFVDHFSYAVGEHAVGVAESAERGLVRSDAVALRQAGFARHHICRNGAGVYELASRTVAAIQDRLGRIDAIIYSTCLPLNGNVGSYQVFRETRDVKHLMDFPASRLQSDFGLSSAMVFGISQQACTGMLGSLYVANALIASDQRMSRILCITADRFPEGAIYEQSYNLISDGAAACIVSTEPAGFRYIVGHAATNGALSISSDDETVGSFFSYAHRVINETLRKARLDIKDIDWIVPQNTNIAAWRIMCHLLPFESERVYCPTLADVGHMISGDNIANLKHMANNGVAKTGERVLLFMAGYGLNWQAIVLEKT